ncbi:hypothetical protein EON73_04830 [bacterium]|nr:MAG: hypothetical protein EON73_04830 [bacterium]
MSIEKKIITDANASSIDVKDKANDEVAKEDLRGQKLKNDITEDDKNERKVYTNLIFTLVSMWLMLILVIVVAIGKGFLKYSDSVIIALIATTTANVIGLFVIVANYLYHNK